MTALRIVAATVLGVGSIAVSACGGSAPKASQQRSASAAERPRIAARVAEYRIRTDRVTAPSGDVSFDIRNDGRLAHDFVVLRSDHSADALPRDSRERDTVAEYDSGTVVDDAEVAPGRTVTLRTSLEPGTYVLLCNLPGHYARGMHTAFRVA
jgi:uncharacterized cupredoxin-like copper-binding protein